MPRWSPFPEQRFLNCFRQIRGKIKGSSWAFCFLKNNQLKITNIPQNACFGWPTLLTLFSLSSHERILFSWRGWREEPRKGQVQGQLRTDEQATQGDGEGVQITGVWILKVAFAEGKLDSPYIFAYNEMRAITEWQAKAGAAHLKLIVQEPK